MKELLSLTLALCLLLALAACGGTGAPEPTPAPTLEATAAPEPETEPEPAPEENPDTEDPAAPDAELTALAEELYAACPVEFMLDTLAMDTVIAQDFTGLDEATLAKVDAGILSMPMIGSQAYSLVLLRLKDAADLESVGQALLDNAPVGRWVCVAPSAVTVGGSGDLLCAVMADEELADPDALVDAFFTAAGSSDLLLETDEVTVTGVGLPGVAVPDGEPMLG